MQAILTLPNRRKGRLHATELAEGDFPMKKIAVGATLNVVTLGTRRRPWEHARADRQTFRGREQGGARGDRCGWW